MHLMKYDLARLKTFQVWAKFIEEAVWGVRVLPAAKTLDMYNPFLFETTVEKSSDIHSEF